jgi:hypothetical protein
MMSEKCDEAVLVDNLKIYWVDGVWEFMANDRVKTRSDYNVLCLDTVGYVTAGNSRLASGYQNSVGTHHCHFRAESIHVYWCCPIYRTDRRPPGTAPLSDTSRCLIDNVT